MAISWVFNGREAAVHGSLFMRIMFWPAGPIPPPVPIVWALAQFMVVAPLVSVVAIHWYARSAPGHVVVCLFVIHVDRRGR